MDMKDILAIARIVLLRLQVIAVELLESDNELCVSKFE